jgi:hypothetical protein
VVSQASGSQTLASASAASGAILWIARRRGEEERGDTLFVPERRRSRRLQSAIRARDVRAADLQEEPTKRVKKQLFPGRSFRRI